MTQFQPRSKPFSLIEVSFSVNRFLIPNNRLHVATDLQAGQPQSISSQVVSISIQKMHVVFEFFPMFV